MRLTLRLSPSLMQTIDQKLEVELSGNTIDDCLQSGSKTYPELNALLWIEGEHLNPQLLLFHNDEQIRERDFTKPIKTGDVLDLIPAIEGG